MSKRFTDTDKYKKPFIRGLQGAYKLFWDYLYHDCDHAGIWIVDFDIAQIYLGKDMIVNKEDSLKYFNSDEVRIIEIDNGKKWFIPSFIKFQYGELSPENRAHNSVIRILKEQKLFDDIKGLTRPLQGYKDKDKAKDKDSDKDIEDGIFIIPTLENIKKYAKEQNIDLILAEKFFNVMETDDWFTSDRNGNKKTFVKNNNKWMRVLSNWNLADIKNGNGKNKIVDAYKELGL